MSNDAPLTDDRAGPWAFVVWALGANAFIWVVIIWQLLTHEAKPLSGAATIGVLTLAVSSVAGLVCMWRLR